MQKRTINAIVRNHELLYVKGTKIHKRRRKLTIVEVITNDTSFIRIHLVGVCKSRKIENGGDGKVRREKIF